MTADHDGDETPDAATDPDGPVQWSELPDGARTAVIAIAARALGSLPADQVPAALAPVARFTPGKRARLGSGPLARALEHDPAFRALAAQQVAGESAPPSGPDEAGGDHDDPVAGLARAFLLHLPRSTELLADAARVDEVAVLRRQVAELTVALERVSAQLARLSAREAAGRAGKGHAVRAGAARAATGGEDGAIEIDRLRKRLRDQGTRVKEAERTAQEQVGRAVAERDAAVAATARESASVENWRHRAEQETQHVHRLQAALDRLSEETGRERADTDRKLEILLDTVEAAATGLRREWRLAIGGADPAEVVARRLPPVDPQRRRSVDPALLIDWLGAPRAHLIVDGYNVTKTGYPELSLADQRDRLARSLAALAARTGAEVTVVFDGAAVVAAAPAVRGVRVMFSPPGVIADDVVRQLAAAEPAGRVVVVVSSDREVVDGARGSGARTAPSRVLLAALG